MNIAQSKSNNSGFANFHSLKLMKIGIIGGAGRMGRFFCRLLSKKCDRLYRL